MKVLETNIPNTKLISNALPEIEFSDCFSTTNHKDNLQLVSHKVFGTFPKWVSVLIRIRNFGAKYFGLKIEKPADYHNRFETGGYVGFFKIYAIQSDEVILGADDKHLNFRVSILNDGFEQHNIKVTTLVQYNNRLGKRYMAFVKPFHRVVIKAMIKQAYTKP